METAQRTTLGARRAFSAFCVARQYFAPRDALLAAAGFLAGCGEKKPAWQPAFKV